MKDTAKTENGLGDVDIAAMMTGIGARAKKGLGCACNCAA